MAKDDVIGLTLRMNTYRTVYVDTEQPTRQDSAQLAAQIAAGGFHPNPARSMVVGVLALWRVGRPALAAG